MVKTTVIYWEIRVAEKSELMLKKTKPDKARVWKRPLRVTLNFVVREYIKKTLETSSVFTRGNIQEIFVYQPGKRGY